MGHFYGFTQQRQVGIFKSVHPVNLLLKFNIFKQYLVFAEVQTVSHQRGRGGRLTLMMSTHKQVGPSECGFDHAFACEVNTNCHFVTRVFHTKLTTFFSCTISTYTATTCNLF